MKLQSYGRPVICTEWLNRPLGSTVAGCLLVFERTNTGCMHWGLVNGKTQSHLGWGWHPGSMTSYHDNHRPCDLAEINEFKAAIQGKGAH